MANLRDSDRDLVAEQPGLGLSFIGLFLAFFMGLAIRAAVSPDRVQEHILHATENIHKDVHFTFKKAYVSFSKGIWPDLSVVVEDVKIEATPACWMTPLAEINEIRLPLSLRHLFRGQILIHEIFADEVNLSLRTPFQECTEKISHHEAVPENRRAVASQASAPSDSAKSESNSKPVMGRFENVSRRNPIDTIQIDSLNIHYLPIAFTSFNIQNFRTRLKSEDPRWIQVTGRLVLDEETLMGDYSSHADLQIDSYEGEKPSVHVSAKGLWREGNYNFTAHWDGQTQRAEVAADALHLPLSQIIPLLKKYRIVESEFNGKRAWVSGHMSMKGDLPHFRETPMSLERLRLEGDLGEIACNQAQIESFQPLRFQPLDFDIRGLNIKELLIFLNRPHPSPALGELGIFNGTAHFVNPEQVLFRGDYSGLEFIFSNRGTRQSQVLSLVSGELELNKNQWNISIDRVKPVEGIFEGKVKMQADKDFKDLKVDAQITELGLSPQVQSLMTGGGSLGALSGQISTHLKSAQVAHLSGQLRWDQLLVEGVRFYRPKMILKTSGEEIQLQVSAQEMELNANSPATQLLSPILQSAPEPAILLKAPTGIIKTRKFASLSWEKVQAQSPWGLLRSQGKWNDNSELSGEIRIQGERTQVWQVDGTRSQPQFHMRAL